MSVARLIHASAFCMGEIVAQFALVRARPTVLSKRTPAVTNADDKIDPADRKRIARMKKILCLE